MKFKLTLKFWMFLLVLILALCTLIQGQQFENKEKEKEHIKNTTQDYPQSLMSSLEKTSYEKRGNFDEKGLIDHIEWTVPHFSNQTYKMIIEISKAEHLNSDRTFVGKVYDFVKARDNNWTTIPEGDYLRVTFEQELDNTKDITLYARSNGSSSVEVYAVDESELLMSFDISEDKEYKEHLTELIGVQDVFDLKVVGGDVEFDYIIDPSVLTITTGNTTLADNKAWYQTKAAGMPPQDPDSPGDAGYAEYSNTDAKSYSNIDTDDSNLNSWSGVNHGYSLWYNFSINVTKTSVTEINVTWEGYDNPSLSNPGDLYWWNFSSSSWVHWADIDTSIATEKVSFSIDENNVDDYINDGGNFYVGIYGGHDSAMKCPLVFTKTSEGKNFEFLLFGVYEDEGNYSSELKEIRLGEESRGYIYLNLEQETNEIELLEIPYETFTSDFYMLRVIDTAENGSVIMRNLSLVNASQALELLKYEDENYYELKSRENLNLTFEEIPEKIEGYGRQIQLVAKGWTDAFVETKAPSKDPFYQEKYHNYTKYWYNEYGTDISLMIIDKNLTFTSYPYEEVFEYEHHTMYEDYVEVKVSYESGASDTCTYSGSGDWNVDLADNCKISTNTDLGENSLIIEGTSGTFTVDANITAESLIMETANGRIVNKANDGKALIIELD